MMRPEQHKDFEDLEASQLFCPTCKRAMPVRKRLFLVLLDKEMFDYICTVAPWCGKRAAVAGSTSMVENLRDGVRGFFDTQPRRVGSSRREGSTVRRHTAP